GACQRAVAGMRPAARPVPSARAPLPKGATQPVVAVAERETEDDAERAAAERQPRLEGDAIAHPAAARHVLQRPLVHPAALREHGRRPEEAAPRLDAQEAEVVVVEGERAEEEEPAAEGATAEGDRRRIEPRRGLGARHAEKRPELVVDARHGRDARPHRGRGGGHDGLDLEGVGRQGYAVIVTWPGWRCTRPSQARTAGKPARSKPPSPATWVYA